MAKLRTNGVFTNLRENIKNSLCFRLGLRFSLFFIVRDVRLIFKVLYLFIDIENLITIRITTFYSLNNYFLDAYCVGLKHKYWAYRDNRDSTLHNFHFVEKSVRIPHYFWNLGFPFSCVIQAIFSLDIFLLLTALIWKVICNIFHIHYLRFIFNFYLVHKFHKAFLP